MKRLFITKIVALSLLITGCKKEFENSADTLASTNEKNVRVEKVIALDQPLPVEATGRVASEKEIVLSFKTGGIVRKLNVDEAQNIKKGQLLAQLDLSEINSQVISAKNNYNKTQRDLERATNLYRDTVATLEQKQNAKTANDIAKSNLDIANFNLQYSMIKAPVNGVVFTKMVEEGELVNPGQAIYKVGNTGSKGSQIVRLGVVDKDVIKISKGDKAIVKFDAFSNQEFNATVTEVGEFANSNTGLFEVEVSLNDYQEDIKNGFIAKVEIFTNSDAKTYKISMDALVEGQDREAIIFYTDDKKTAKKIAVQIKSFSDNFFTVIAPNIPKDAWIVTSGAPYLNNNDTINIIQ